MASLNSITAAHVSAGFPGAFTVQDLGVAISIEPSQVRDVSGVNVAAGSILQASISFPAQQRTAYETLRLILQKVSDSSGISVAIGAAPVGLLLSSKSTLGFTNGPARDAILQLVTSLKAPLSYRLLYDPTGKAHFFNLVMVIRPQRLPGSTQPAVFPPNSGVGPLTSPWFDVKKP